MIDESIVVVDIETAVAGKRPDPEKDTLKFVGFMLPSGEYKMFDFTKKGEIQYGLTEIADMVVGHNFKDYDAVVLRRHGFHIPNNRIIDTFEITKKRTKTMMRLDLSNGEMSLRSLAIRFDLPSLKGDIDYDIFKQGTWSSEELEEIERYLRGDLETTLFLFKYYYDFFIGFRDFVSEKDKKRLVWLTASSGGVAYKTICNMAGIEEEYNDVQDREDVQYQGGFVALPEDSYYDGDIYCIDFASLYPHMFIGGNLYSPVHSSRDGWSGSGVFHTLVDGEEDGIRGKYSRRRGPIEQAILDLYNMRVSIKDSMKSMSYGSTEYILADRKQYAIKIVINTMYGISGSPLFKNVYNLVTAADCTSMARMAIKHARQYLTDKGFECLYTDTDSVYVRDPYHNKDYITYIAKEITRLQRESFNIDIESHDFEIESHIKRMYFFKNDKGKFNKKLYLYVTDDDKANPKGIPIVKGNVSPLAKEIFEKEIEPKALSGEPIVGDLETIESYIREYVTVDSIKKRYRVDEPSAYKNTTSIQAQISAMYGPGEHWLIPNTKVGAGKGIKYGTLEEISSYGDVLEFVDIRKYIGELKHFIEWDQRKRIDLIGQSHVCKSFKITDEENATPLNQDVECRTCGARYKRIKLKKSMKWRYFSEIDRE